MTARPKTEVELRDGLIDLLGGDDPTLRAELAEGYDLLVNYVASVKNPDDKPTSPIGRPYQHQDGEVSMSVTIFIAGDLNQAKQTCREWCMEVGACVTVEPLSYIYTGGEEAGVRVGFINYPRFPSDEAEIAAKATDLGHRLMHRLCQHSFSVVAPGLTEWHSRRPEPASPHSPLQDRDGEVNRG